jgi:hypothetical protein
MSEGHLFERAIVKVEADGNIWNVWLSCGHKTTFVIWPYSPVVNCAQCVNDYVEKERHERVRHL